MLLVDTHTHLYADAFNADRPDLIKAAMAKGIGRFYLPNIDAASIGPMLELEAARPGVCIPMMGLHPRHVQQDWQAALKR